MYWLLFKHQRTFKVPLTQADIYERLSKWFRRVAASSTQTVKYEERDPNTFESTIKLNIKSREEVLQVEFNLTITFDSTYYKTTFEDFYIYYLTEPGQSKRTAMHSDEEWAIMKKYVENVQNSIYKNVLSR